MAFCINCGIQLPDGSKFCPSCGTQQPEAPAPAPAITPAPAPAPIPEAEPVPVLRSRPAAMPVPEPISEPESEPIPEPIPEPEPVTVSIPVQEPVYEQSAIPSKVPEEPASTRLGSPIMQAESDMETGEEPDPVVGTYRIPSVTDQSPGLKKSKRQRSSGSGKNLLPVILGAVGGVIVLAIIVTAAFMIFKKVGKPDVPSGTGTALVQIVDNAAYNIQNGN